MRLIGNIAICILIATSCSSPVKRPKDIIAPDKMVLILTDVHLTEGAKTGRQVMGDTLRVETYYQKVFNKYGTSLAQFNKSFAYYTKHPDEMNTIYEQVVESLNRIEVRVPKWEKEEAAALDSNKFLNLKKQKLKILGDSISSNADSSANVKP